MKTEKTILSTSGLYNINKDVPEISVMERFGISAALFTENRCSTFHGFPILPELRNELYIDENVRAVCVAGHDTAAASCIIPSENGTSPVLFGNIKTSVPFVISGTWSMMGIGLSHPFIGKEMYDRSFVNMAGVNYNTLILKGISGLFVMYRCREHFRNKTGKKITFDEMEKAATVIPRAEYLIDLSHPIFGSFCDDMPFEIKKYCQITGQREPDTDSPGMLARCVYDSLALEYAYTMENISEALGRQWNEFYVTGGGACDAEFCRTIADATGMTVIAGIKNASAAGNVAMQLVACGKINSLDDIPSMIMSSYRPQVFIPDASKKDFWRNAFTKYKKLKYAIYNIT